jgi:hypothetical protein
MEGFKTVITELLKEDRIIAKEKRIKKRKIKLADVIIPPNKQEKSSPLLIQEKSPQGNLSSQITQVTASANVANTGTTRTVQFKEEP